VPEKSPHLMLVDSQEARLGPNRMGMLQLLQLHQLGWSNPPPSAAITSSIIAHTGKELLKLRWLNEAVAKAALAPPKRQQEATRDTPLPPDSLCVAHHLHQQHRQGVRIGTIWHPAHNSEEVGTSLTQELAEGLSCKSL